MHGLKFWLILSVTIACASIIALPITIKYCYTDEIIHFKQAICHIDKCEVSKYAIYVYYELVYNNRNYAKIVSCVSDKDGPICKISCNKTHVDCYFDDRNVELTLRLDGPYNNIPGYMFEAIMLVSMIGALAVVSSTGAIVYIMFCYTEPALDETDSSTNNTNDVDVITEISELMAEQINHPDRT